MSLSVQSDRPIPDVDVPALVKWMRSLGLQVSLPLTARSLGGGRSNLTYLIDDAKGRSWVLRRPPLGHLLESAHDVGREYRILRSLRDTGVPVPRVLGFSAPGETAAVPLVLMEHVRGVVIDSREAAWDLGIGHRRAASESLVDALASIHAVDLQATGLDDLASHGPYAPRQLKRWLRQWQASKTREIPEVEEVHGRLASAVPPQGEVTLVHGDFHLLNAMVEPVTGRVSAILDWELSTLGDPLADVGGLLAYWAEAGDATPTGLFSMTALEGFPSRRDLAERYSQQTGRELSTLAFWEALANWKVAIILEGVRKRVLEEPGNGEPLDGEVVRRFAQRAKAVAGRAGL